jgi:gliding motility-associated-like protein
MSKKAVLIFILTLVCSLFFGQDKSTSEPFITPHVNPALRFTENAGQWDDAVLFRAQLDGGALFLEKNCITFDFYDKNKFRELHHGGIIKGKYRDLIIKGHSYKMFFESCNSNAKVERFQPGPDYENFFLGNDKSKWKSGVKNFQQVFLKGIYPGIDYEAITSVGGIKYNFVVKPNANSSVIKLRYEGVDHLKIKNGALHLKLSVNEITEHKPYAYQMINGVAKEIKCNYKLTGNILGFEFPEGYDRNYELVIDPVLVFAAQSGSLADNFGMTATYDAAGNFYTGGTCFANGYPTTVGSYTTSFTGPVAQGNTDVVITKFNPTGNSLLYSTYIGGTSAEIVTSLIVDNSNNLCFYGATGSANFPMTAGCYDPIFNNGTYLSFIYNGTTFNNGTDIYVAKFNSTGTTLMASTYLGGSQNDGVNHVNTLQPLPPPNQNILEYLPDSLQHNYGDQYRGEIQVDIYNNIYIASSTRSSDFPTVNAYDNTLGGPQDAIVAKFNSALTQLVYCTFLGGSSNDCGNSLVVNINQEVYVTGGTCSQNFPTTSGTYSQTYFGGIADGYLAHLSAGGNQLLQSTYLGTATYDQSYIVQTDRNNNIYTYGQSLGNMPVISYSSTPVYSVANTHQFITRFNNTLSNINMSTVFGSATNSIDISPSAFAVDKCDNIYLSGWGGSIVPPVNVISNMPMASPTQSTTDGHDFYLMGLSPNAGSLLYGSYFGGNQSEEHVDGGTSRFDSRGVIYQSVCAGCGQNQDFPVTPFAWPCPTITPCTQPNKSNNCNNGVFKINFQLLVAVSTINTNTVAGCMPLTVSFTNATPATGTNTSYMWYFGNGATSSTAINPVVTYTNPGTYTVSLVVNDPNSCNVKDSAVTFINVYPAPNTAFIASVAPCTNSLTVTNNSTGTLSANPYLWNFGDGSATSTLSAPAHTYTNNGTFTVNLTVTSAGGCTTAATQTVSIFNFTPVVTSASICNGVTTTISATGGTSYTWTPASGLSNPNIGSPAANPTTTTIYTVTINNNSPGYTCNSTLTTQVTVFQKPSAAFGASINPCGGGVYFSDLSVSNITAWQWTLSSTATSTMQNPYNFYGSGGTHTVTLIVTNGDGCKDTTQQVVTVGTPPPVAINSSSLICSGNTAQLSASGGSSYQWTPTVSLDMSNISSPVSSPTISTTYSVVITATNGCNFLLTTTVNVSQVPGGPVSAIADPPYVITGNGTTLTYLGSPGSVVTWYPFGSTIPGTGYTVTATPNKPTTYTVVAVTGACVQRTTVHVEAYTEGCIDKDVYIPNTFTPNSDGQNDIFIVRGLKVQEIYFAIYNRWGEMVFETSDKTRGWDGIYKGRPADVGVFGWYLKVKCFNGEETFRKGNVTLIR